MPIIIETPVLSQALPQDDTIDLEKIYADYPNKQALQRLNKLNAAQQQSWQLYVARFNSRLLGAAWLQLNNQDATSSTLIHDLCVRKITRRRGVGSRLLSIILQQHPHARFAEPPPELSDSALIALTALTSKFGL